MNEPIKSLEELKALPIGSQIYIVQNSDVRSYTICCHHPNPAIDSVLISYGTGDSCSKWVGKTRAEHGNIYVDYKIAVNRLIADLESDLEAVKRIYLKKDVQ